VTAETQLRSVDIGGLEIGYLERGPANGPLALCLHGFPDTAHTWRHLLPALGEAGYHAVAPFLRGYAPTAVPADGRYQTGALVADAIALHTVLGGDGDAVLVGHDWGAMAAYGAASHAPDRWRRLVTVAVPPVQLAQNPFADYDSIQRMAYMFFFQSPIADMVVPLDDYGYLRRLWEVWSAGYDPDDDLAEVRRALGTPENLAAALGYYRALFGPGDVALEAEQDSAAQIPVQPILYIHGAIDGCVPPPDLSLESALPPGSRLVVMPDAGHFLHLERADVFNELALTFLSES
jgi:pimeloyl-ACP methyl ester carboxylesterase